MRLILVLTAAAFALYLVFPPPFPFIQTDSGSYIRFEAMRTPGYPLILSSVERIAGDLHAIIPLQVFAMVGSAGYLGIELRRLTGSTSIGALALVLIVGNIFIYRYAFTVMTEALFFSGVAVLIALLCRFAASGGIGTIAAMSLVIAVCILIRPAAYVFVPILFVCVVLQIGSTRQWWRPVACALLPVVVILAAGSLVYYNKHGTFRTQSFLGHNLIGKIAYVPGDHVESRYPEIVTLINRYMDPLRAVRIDNLQDRFLFRERHYDFVRYGLTTPTVVRTAAGVRDGARQSSEEGGPTERDAGRPDSEENIRKEVAFAFIKAHPVSFAEEVALQLYSLWTVTDLRTAADNRRFKAMIESLPFDPFKDTVTPGRTPMPWPVVYGIRAFMLGILVVTLVAFGYAALRIVRRKPIDPAWAALALIALLLHGYFFLVAALQVGYFRYLIVMWPAIIAIAALTGYIGLDGARRLTGIGSRPSRLAG